MYLAPVSGRPLAEREEVPRAGLERPFGQPGRASEHARTAAPFTGATAQKKDVVASRTSAERLSPLGREPGRKSLKNRRGDGDDDGDGDDAGRACLSVRVSTSRRPSSALTGPRPAPRESAEGAGPVAGSVGYHRFARARTTGRGPGRARASLALAANTAGAVVLHGPRASRRTSSSSSSLPRGRHWARTLSRSPGLCEARRALW